MDDSATQNSEIVQLPVTLILRRDQLGMLEHAAREEGETIDEYVTQLVLETVIGSI